MSVAVLISAAGRGTRINTPDLPKQYLSLCGVSVLRHTINAFINHPKVDHILVVIHPDDIELYKEAVIGLDLLPPVFGGARRQDSVRLGLDALKEFSPTKVLIHDAARPFISKQIISTVINQLDIAAAAIPAIPLDDTIKKCADGKTLWTVDRTDLWRVQTPQGFLFSEIIDQHHLYQDKNFTDDASVSEYAGIAVSIIPGSANNFKITTDADYERAVLVASQQINNVSKEIRVGTGLDVHKFSNEKSLDGILTMGGIQIAHPFKLIGHSDADVVLHSVTDAILGAIGGKDIGFLFPDTDVKWKGADSALFLKEAINLARKKSATINNIDLTIICEKPRISQYRDEMQKAIANIVGINETRVNIKGKTTEKLGFLGRGEGVAVQAVATVSITVTEE